jgi:aspartyl-tRNA(Asn)/glutamyl-tRNA(Gln) amidotransferase subunit C
VTDGRTPVIDDETLARLEELARLELAPDERERVKADLAAVLGFVAQLADLPEGPGAEDLTAPERTRPDVPRPGLPRDAALALAPAARDGYFEVPRTVDEG